MSGAVAPGRCVLARVRRHLAGAASLIALGWAFAATAGPALPPIVIGISAEYGMKGSQAAQSIEKGVRLAAEEINAAGGLLGGRKVEILARDDRGVPARSLDHLREMIKNPDVVATFCGRFSPVALELAPVANQEQILLLDPWAAADGITQAAGKPNYVFRLSLTDTWAMEAMLQHALKRKLDRVAVFLPNTAWGRSSEAAAAAFVRKTHRLRYNPYWYNWGDTEFADKLAQARAEGAKALVVVANEAEGAIIARLTASLPPEHRLPIIFHWGITAGDFAAVVGPAIQDIDLLVVQTFSFAGARNARAGKVAQAYQKQFGAPVDSLLAQPGFAHAYDMTHLLAMAVAKAGSSDRAKIRDALEQLPAYDGLVRRYARPFTADRHEALDSSQVFMARYSGNGTLVPAK